VEHSRIYLVGFMGAGKTTIGRLLASRLGWTFLDLDEEIERREGRSIAEIFSRDGEPCFRDLERACLKDVSTLQRAVIALGGGAFIDPENRKIAEETGLTVWLKVSFDALEHRVRMDGTRPKFTDKAQAARLYQMRQPFYAFARIHVSTDAAGPESAVDEILGALRKS
jgi:shikimate kinase